MDFISFALFIVSAFCVFKAQEGYILATSKQHHQRQNSKSTITNGNSNNNDDNNNKKENYLSNSRYYSQETNNNILGIAGKDYPNFNTIPQTQFDCDSQLYPGYYADPESNCQMYHICQPGGRKDSFLCANGTIFNQERLVCEWWHNVDCSQARAKYSINEAIIKEMEKVDRLNAERKAAQAFEANDKIFQIRGEIHDAQQPPQGYRIKMQILRK